MKKLLVMVFSAGLALSASATGALAGTTPHVLGTAAIPRGLHARPVCAQTGADIARCLSYILAYPNGRVFSSPLPSGYGPADLQSAYNLPSSNHGSGETVAIVDAYDDPNAEADLAVYRSTFGLPACTTANGCFTKLDEHGGTNYPAPSTGWAVEISLDLDMVSAICPNCHIMLVEGDGGWIRALGTAVNTAARLGANAISNSYANRGKPKDPHLENRFYNHPGIAITAGSGDWGYNNFRTFPASSQYVVAVGGTTLTRGGGGSRGWTEAAWSGAGSECAPYTAKPAWQKDTGCTNRTVSDVSAVAGSGVAIYDTYNLGGWEVVEGTSVATPIIASVFALAGDSVMYGSRVYMNPNKLYDVTSGSNGSCGGSYLCTAGAGYDGPTGLGTPNGIGDF